MAKSGITKRQSVSRRLLQSKWQWNHHIGATTDVLRLTGRAFSVKYMFARNRLSPRRCAMKKDIHPKYRPVIFLDSTANFSFLTRSTVKSNDTMKWTDGKEYPVVRLDISSASHPFFTGKMKFI